MLATSFQGSANASGNVLKNEWQRSVTVSCFAGVIFASSNVELHPLLLRSTYM